MVNSFIRSTGNNFHEAATTHVLHPNYSWLQVSSGSLSKASGSHTPVSIGSGAPSLASINTARSAPAANLILNNGYQGCRRGHQFRRSLPTSGSYSSKSFHAFSSPHSSYSSTVSTSPVQVKGMETFYIQVEAPTGALYFSNNRPMGLAAAASMSDGATIEKPLLKTWREISGELPLITASSTVGKDETNAEGSMEYAFCKIHVLLVAIQIAVGATMTGLSVFLHSISPSLMIQDCPFWASAPLLITGILGLYFCLPRTYIDNCSKMTKFMRILSCLLSLSCIILGIAASIFSGRHGNWISVHTEVCPQRLPNGLVSGLLIPCCHSSSPENLLQQLNETSRRRERTTPSSAAIQLPSCTCYQPNEKATGGLNPVAKYESIDCYYLFSALKDYLILQCSLLGLGAAVSLWMLIILIRWNRVSLEKHSENSEYQSPCSS